MFFGNGALVTTRNIPSLPDYGCWSLHEVSNKSWKPAVGSITFVTSLLRLITEVVHVHKGMATKVKTTKT